MAFQALMVTMRLTSAATSCGLNLAATSWYAWSGTCVSDRRVTDSVNASAARSRGVKYGVSGQAASP